MITELQLLHPLEGEACRAASRLLAQRAGMVLAAAAPEAPLRRLRLVERPSEPEKGCFLRAEISYTALDCVFSNFYRKLYAEYARVLRVPETALPDPAVSCCDSITYEARLTFRQPVNLTALAKTNCNPMQLKREFWLWYEKKVGGTAFYADQADARHIDVRVVCDGEALQRLVAEEALFRFGGVVPYAAVHIGTMLDALRHQILFFLGLSGEGDYHIEYALK